MQTYSDLFVSNAKSSRPDTVTGTSTWRSLDRVDDQRRLEDRVSDAETEAWHLSFVDVYLKEKKVDVTKWTLVPKGRFTRAI